MYYITFILSLLRACISIVYTTLALIINKSVASWLLGVARLYLIIIAHNAAPVSRAHKKLKFHAESAVVSSC